MSGPQGYDYRDVAEKCRKLGRDFNMAKYGEPDFAWSLHLEAMADLQAENDRLRAAMKD